MKEMNLPSGLSWPLEICGFPKKRARSNKGVPALVVDSVSWQNAIVEGIPIAKRIVIRLEATAYFIEKLHAEGLNSGRESEVDHTNVTWIYQFKNSAVRLRHAAN